MSKTFIHHGSYESIPSTNATSPGLLFLRDFLPALESLEPIHPHPVARFIAPDAVWIVNSNNPAMTSQVLPMLELRKKHVSKFHHDVRTVWDVELEGDVDRGLDVVSSDDDHRGRDRDRGKEEDEEEAGEDSASINSVTRQDKGRRGRGRRRRTVMYQATSGTVFKQDPEQFEVRMEEFNIVELLAEKEKEGSQEEHDSSSTSSSTSTAPYGYKAIGLRTFVDARPVMERAGELQAQFAQGAA